MQRLLDEHHAYTTTQMMYLQEQITALSTQIRDLVSEDQHIWPFRSKKGGVVNEGEQNFETLFTSLIVLFSCFKFYLQCFILKLSILQLKTQCTSLLQYCVPWFLQPFLDAFSYLLFFALVSLMHQMLVGHATNFCTAFNCLRVQMIIYQLNVHCGHFLMTISI